MFLKSRLGKGLAHETVRWYRGILNAFSTAFPELPRGATEIEGFLADCKAGDERRHGYYRALRCFYRFLVKRKIVAKTKNPFDEIDPPRRRPKQPRFLMPEELNQLLVYPHPPKIKAALLFLVDTGARLGELHSLSIDTLAETPWGFTATITGKTGTRTVPINYETYHYLMGNLPLDYTKHRLGRKIAEAFIKAGIKGNALLLRHSFGTLWEGDELVLQEIMGHAHLSTTKIYRHLRTKTLSEQHRQYSPLNMVLSQSKSML